MKETVHKYCLVIIINILIFVLLFSFVELSYRMHREGLKPAIYNLIELFRAVPYSNLGTGNWVIYDEQLGYRLNPDRPEINSLSIRYSDIIDPKPKGVYRILVLGDSIPWDKVGFVEYTEDILKKELNVEVINAAVPGYTAYQEVLFFKRFLQNTQPDLVLWTYCLNDNHKFLHRFDESAKMLLTDEALQSLKADSLIAKLVSRSYVLSEIKLRIPAMRNQPQSCRFAWECAPDFNIAWKDAPWAQYESYVAEMKRLTDRLHSHLAILVFPFEPQLEKYDQVGDTEYIVKPQKQISLLCEKYDVPCMDFFPAFLEQQRNSIKLFRDGIHLTPKGHELTALLTYAFLHEKGLLSLTR